MIGGHYRNHDSMGQYFSYLLWMAIGLGDGGPTLAAGWMADSAPQQNLIPFVQRTVPPPPLAGRGV